MRRVTAVFTAVALGWGLTSVLQVRAQADPAKPAQVSPVSFRLASETAMRGFEKMTTDRGETVYVASRELLSGGEVTAVATGEGNAVAMSLAKKTVERLASTMKKQGANRVAVFTNGELTGAGALKVDVAGSRVVLSGLSPAQVDGLVRVFDGEAVLPVGPTITVVPGKASLAPGEAVAADIFLSGAANLRTYQLGLVVTGGARGSVSVESLSIDGSRGDFVFGARQKIDAVDQEGGRLGAMLFSGGIDVSRPAYLGTCILRASADANGSFSVNLRMDQTTFLRNPENLPIGFYAGPPAIITVGAAARTQPTGE